MRDRSDLAEIARVLHAERGALRLLLDRDGFVEVTVEVTVVVTVLPAPQPASTSAAATTAATAAAMRMERPYS